jgi:pyruvate formate lyase activating enzyme
MEIGGFQRVSLIDYPGKITSIVFLTGCNMRCPFCHNSDLVLRNYGNLTIYAEEEILGKLAKAKGFVEAVEITGGEPTLHKGLLEFMEKCKKLGLLVKLDTNGSNPAIVREILEKGLVDYIAMDIKTELDRNKYKKASGVAGDQTFDNILESIKVIMNSNVDYEFRTTVVPSLVELDDIAKIAKAVVGANAYYVQQFVPGKTLDPLFSKTTPYPTESLVSITEGIKATGLLKKCEMRGEKAE